MRFSPLLLGVTLAAAAAVLPDRAEAAESSLFVVRGVSVDRTADTATQAREEAIAEGHVLALRQLFDRLVPAYDRANVPDLSAEQIQSYVLDYAVENEKTSPVRYLADLTFRFQGEEIRSLLRSSGVNFAITESKPLLVLPLYGNESHLRLWEEPNPWMRVWSLRHSEDRLVPLIVPLGDLNDISTIDAESVLRGDLGRMRDIAYAYGAEDALITQALISGDLGAGNARLQVISRRAGALQEPIVATLRQEGGESLEALLARAADAVDAQIQEKWKLANLLDFGDRRFMSVAVETFQLGDWLAIKRRLDDVASVESVQITRLARGWSEIDLTYVGDEQRLSVALAQRDLQLTARFDGGWELRLDPTVARPTGGLGGSGTSGDTGSQLGTQ